MTKAEKLEKYGPKRDKCLKKLALLDVDPGRIEEKKKALRAKIALCEGKIAEGDDAVKPAAAPEAPKA